MSVLDNVSRAAHPDEGAEFSAEDANFQERFPGIFEMLARIKYNGKDRVPGKLFLYYDGGKAALCLSDKHTGQVAFHLADGLEEAIEGLERRLQAGTVDWRKSKKWQG